MAKSCPICGMPSKAPHAPFCSKRCSMRDLARWIGGDEPYVIEGEPLVPEPGEPQGDGR